MDELAVSYDHLKLAAGHLAGGAAERITPTYDRAVGATTSRWNSAKGTFEPMYTQVREGANRARGRIAPAKKKRSKTPLVIGLLAAGAAVGAAGAVAMRRRRAMNQWDDYEPLSELESSFGMGSGLGSAGMGSAGMGSAGMGSAGMGSAGMGSGGSSSGMSSAKDKVAHGVSSVKTHAAKVADKVSDAGDKTAHKHSAEHSEDRT